MSKQFVAARDRFADLVAGGTVICVDPVHCIPLTKVRSISESGVRRLMHAFSNAKEAPGLSSGHSSGGGMPVVVDIDESMRSEAIAFNNSEQGMSSEQAKSAYEDFPQRYGVVDGAHRLVALVRLAHEMPEHFSGYSWYVLKINNARMDMLKAFARDRNEKLRKEHIVEFTLYDVLRNLKDVAVAMCVETDQEFPGNGRSAPKGFNTAVADRYCGGEGTAKDTTRQLAGIAVHLSDEVLHCLGSILNGEFSDLARSHYCRTKSTSIRADKLVIDHRIYHKIINTTTIRGATAFRKAPSDEDRVNALHRAQYFATTNGFKGISAEKLDRFTVAAISARKEAEKFSVLIGGDRWPSQLNVMKNNLLRTTKFDDEVQRNLGNDSELVQALVDIYKSHFPLVASQRLRWFRTRIRTPERDTGTFTEENPSRDVGIQECNVEPLGTGISGNEQGPSNDHPTYSGNGARQSNISNGEIVPPEGRVLDQDVCLSEQVQSPHVQAEVEQTTRSMERETNLLEKFKIRCHELRWQDFERSIVSSQGMYEMILADPPYSLPSNPANTGAEYSDYIDDKEMSDFAQFARRMLVPGGCCLIFTSFQLMTRWATALQSASMKVMNVPMIFVKKTDMLQRSRRERAPQGGSEMAIVCWSPGRHRDNFRTDFVSEYTLIKCSHKRKFAVIDNIPVPRQKLQFPNRKKPVRVEEKSTLLLSELMKTFCPEEGHVLDPYAGTMTTAIACMATGRPCTVVEADPQCYKHAFSRLMQIADKYMERHGNKRETRARTDASTTENNLLHLLEATNVETLSESDNEPSSPEQDECNDEFLASERIENENGEVDKFP